MSGSQKAALFSATIKNMSWFETGLCKQTGARDIIHCSSLLTNHLSTMIFIFLFLYILTLIFIYRYTAMSIHC